MRGPRQAARRVRPTHPVRGALAVMMAFALGWVVSCSGEAPPREGAQGATAPATALGIRFGASDSAPVDLSTHGAGRVTVAVHDPYEDHVARFEALPAVALFDELLGAGWRTADELVFECADGYRAAVPVARFLEHRAYLAFARADADFAIDKPVAGEVERTSLAPAYLVWENLLDAQVRSEGDWGWPYQIVRVTLASAGERYARMAPPTGADERVVHGFATFRRYCSRCHAINGEGGEVGPELNYPASVTEYLEPTWLRRWIDAPLTVRHGTPMPGLPPGIPEREAALDDLIAYLTAMAGRKLAPEGAH